MPIPAHRCRSKIHPPPLLPRPYERLWEEEQRSRTRGWRWRSHPHTEVDAADGTGSEGEESWNVIILRALPIATQTVVTHELKRHCTVHPFQAAPSGHKILGLKTVLGL